MKFCNFCAKKHEQIHTIGENIVTIPNQTVTILDGLKIFQNEITKFILDDLDSVICTICLKLLKSSYEFVQQIKEAEMKLSLGRDIKNEHDYFETKKKVNIKKTENVTEHTNLRLGLDGNISNLNFIPILPKTSNMENHKKKSKGSSLPKSRLYKCLECTETFKSFKHLHEHEQESCSHTSLKNVFTCKYCHVCFNKEDSLHIHQTAKHTNGQFLCYLCQDKFFAAKGYLTRHIDKIHQHKSLQYFCGECENMVMIPSQDELRQHFRQKHPLYKQTDTKDYQREDDLNDDDMDLEMHEEFLDEFLLAHTNENSFQFSECWEALDLHLPDMLQGSSTNLTNHQEFTEAFTCPKCMDQFKNPQPLLKHLAEYHNMPVLICRICREAFASLKDFKIHKQKKCLENSTINTLSLACPYCKKTFKNSLNLKQHLRIVHTQLKRHICQLCDKQFSTLDHLKKHVLSQHQNERKHVCKVCDKTFTQLGHLKQHLAIHTTGKTLQCLKCTTKFWRKIDLERHIQKKHRGGTA